MKGTLWTVVAIACTLALLVPLVSGGLQDATTERVEQDATVDYNNATTLNETGNGVLALTITANDTELTNSSDYIFQRPDTIDWQNTTNSSAGDAALIEYTYDATTQETRDATRILSTMGTWAGLLLLIAALGYVITLIGGGDF